MRLSPPRRFARGAQRRTLVVLGCENQGALRRTNCAVSKSNLRKPSPEQPGLNSRSPHSDSTRKRHKHASSNVQAGVDEKAVTYCSPQYRPQESTEVSSLRSIWPNHRYSVGARRVNRAFNARTRASKVTRTTYAMTKVKTSASKVRSGAATRTSCVTRLKANQATATAYM